MMVRVRVVWVLSRKDLFCVLNSNNAQGQETLVGNQRGERLPGAPRPVADSFCQRRIGGYRSWDALGGLAPPQRPRGQQRRGYSHRTSERSRHLVGARVVWEAKRDGKLGVRRP